MNTKQIAERLRVLVNTCGKSSMVDADRITISAAADLLERMAWQPIETAPKDGAEFQAWCVTDDGDGFWAERCIINDYGQFGIWGRIDYDEEGYDYGLTHIRPTHWMPLPDPPSE